jgi:hypothetical protein
MDKQSSESTYDVDSRTGRWRLQAAGWMWAQACNIGVGSWAVDPGACGEAVWERGSQWDIELRGQFWENFPMVDFGATKFSKSIPCFPCILLPSLIPLSFLLLSALNLQLNSQQCVSNTNTSPHINASFPSSDWSNHLGGEDFDVVLVDHIINSFKETGIDLAKDQMAIQPIRKAAEKAKVKLSSTCQTEVNLSFLSSGPSGPQHIDQKLLQSRSLLLSSSGWLNPARRHWLMHGHGYLSLDSVRRLTLLRSRASTLLLSASPLQPHMYPLHHTSVTGKWWAEQRGNSLESLKYVFFFPRLPLRHKAHNSLSTCSACMPPSPSLRLPGWSVFFFD